MEKGISTTQPALLPLQQQHIQHLSQHLRGLTCQLPRVSLVARRMCPLTQTPQMTWREPQLRGASGLEDAGHRVLIGIADNVFYHIYYIRSALVYEIYICLLSCVFTLGWAWLVEGAQGLLCGPME